ncbi:methyl-accepting chemotaxis protein [Paracerasibacillus soli]|uniref:Methyl-accepting chemotaxis protein n=1 Tax=Paracerasibacillus soli TaxID=480284 RepID=A0ABU5CVI4_9BACI|nr:methyl-accepting chemotaxis protein [Virgibacillus soli]MDY0410389.1 methyl-accepting chemotaxis protein [Virgibacillus soli]
MKIGKIKFLNLGKRGKPSKKAKHKNKQMKQKNKISWLNWKDYSIGRKYITIFSISFLLIMIAGGIVYSLLSTSKDNMRLVEEHSARVSDMSDLASLIQVKDVQISDYLLTKSSRYIRAFEEFQTQFEQLIKKIEPKIANKEQQSLLTQIIENNEKVNQIFNDEMLPALESKQEYVALSTRNQTSQLRANTIELVNALMTLVKKEEAKSVQAASQSLQQSQFLLSILIVLAIAIGTAFMIVISRGISRKLKDVVVMTSEVARGNLNVLSLEFQGKNELGELTTSVNQMKENIRNIISNVTDASKVLITRSEEFTQSATEVKEGSEQIAATMEQLSAGSETQANSASVLSEKMNDFAQKVSLSDKSSVDVVTRAVDVRNLTKTGENLMEESIKQMNQIDRIVADAVLKVKGLDEQSEQISNLVGVIKDIAGQTNLLSLNAAIEAARAGEHGRGFAVVADEVRKLSEQVAQSVGEITTIVENIQQETDHVVDSLNHGYDEVKTGQSKLQLLERISILLIIPLKRWLGKSNSFRTK